MKKMTRREIFIIYIKYWLSFRWYLQYVTRKKLLLKKMNKFEDWIYYKYCAKDFQDYVEKVT